VRAVGTVSVPATAPPPVLVAALGLVMLRTAGELADGTVTWMTGPRTLASHIVPTIARAAAAAGRPDPRVVAGLVVCVTGDEAQELAGVVAYETLGKDAALAVPTPEHYLPLLYVLAQCRHDEPASFPVEGFDGGSVSMLSVRIG
jgi:alkanesulfonate monooxygenase SsuD/methylene tetrahydromethanopterin reductase-like flavin-dependent oxidoreductase (luciferase family)